MAVDIVLYFILGNINYIHLFDIKIANILFTLILLFILLFFFTYLIERIYGEIAYKKYVKKNKEEVKKEVNN